MNDTDTGYTPSRAARLATALVDVVDPLPVAVVVMTIVVLLRVLAGAGAPGWIG